MTAEQAQTRTLLGHLGQARNVDGMLLLIRCTRVTCRRRGRARYEVQIQGDSEIGIFDVAGDDEAVVRTHIDSMVDAFLAARQLRRRCLG